MTETLSAAMPADVERKTRAVLEAAVAAEQRLGTAESCTGGLLASLLTDVDGASHIFESGFVVYSDAAKAALLGINPAAIEQYGAVSREIAVAMAKHALDRAPADIVLAITGFAGQAGNGDEPGLVHLACARRDGALIFREEHFGDIGRGAVRVACMRTALDMLADMVTMDR